jgi:NAD(P)-dependent dehydrogenase (short-subunit alcohol dehydrogenase family)
MGQMDGKTCVITGGAGSIGRASAKRLLDDGARVMLVDSNAGGLDAAAAALGDADRVATIAADVTDGAATRDYLGATVAKWGNIDVIFSNAGISGEIKPVTDVAEDVFDRVMAVNVRASFLACKYGVPHMNDGGAIVMTSSIVGVTSNPGIVAYATSKHAIIGLMRTVAKELAPRNIRVNVIAPGPVDNDFQLDVEEKLGAAIGGNGTDYLNARIPLGRHATADEIAEMVLFLASPRSSFCTGSIYLVDGGLNV